MWLTTARWKPWKLHFLWFFMNQASTVMKHKKPYVRHPLTNRYGCLYDSEIPYLSRGNVLYYAPGSVTFHGVQCGLAMNFLV
ncbi:hypothetical protein F4859DRAFT_490359 [Xylaria cf. heliscus]|nr:hypothetical protein F4859DRAFT_490359 [Xylaria cf. heliscus]